MKNKPTNLNLSEPMSIEEAISGIANDFTDQYTDEELTIILGKNPTELKAYLQEVSVANIEFATGILPGRPSRPRKPTV